MKTATIRFSATVFFLGLFVSGCSKVVYDTGGYVSRTEFTDSYGWAYSLPETAEQVRAKLETRGTQENTLYLKFRADIKAIPNVLQQWAQDPRFSGKGNRVQPALPINKGDYGGVTGGLDWWQPQRIKNGEYINIPEAGGRGIRVWVDIDASIVYVCDEG